MGVRAREHRCRGPLTRLDRRECRLPGGEGLRRTIRITPSRKEAVEVWAEGMADDMGLRKD